MVRAELVQVTREDSRAQAVVLFTDDTTFKRLETFDLLNDTEDSFRQRVEGRRSQLAQSVTFLAKVAPGMDLSVKPVTADPDPARTQWLLEYRKLQHLNRTVAAGFLAADDKAVADQTALVKSTFLPAYSDVV